MMLQRRKSPRMGLRETPQLRSQIHLKWVRGHCCAVQNPDCEGKIEAAHVRSGTDGAMGVKPSDNWSIPLCSGHHRHQHQIGETAFEKQFSVSMRKIAQELWAKSPARKKES